MNETTGVDSEFSFLTFYLGKLPETVLQKDKYRLKFLLASSQKAITREWLQLDPPTLDQTYGIIKQMYWMERLTFVLGLQLEEKWIVSAPWKV